MNKNNKKKYERVPDYFKTGVKPIPVATLPEKYAKPMLDMIKRFTETNLMPGNVACSPYSVAVAVAIVIVLWDRPIQEMVITKADKEALRFAVKQIQADPDLARKLTGIELTRTHLKLMEALAL